MSQTYDPLRSGSKGKMRGLAGTVFALKTTPGTLVAAQVTNQDTVAAWIQFFDLAAGSVVLGTTTPDLELVVPAGSTTPQLFLGFFPDGVPFQVAISVASTTTSGGAIGSAASKVNLSWQVL